MKKSRGTIIAELRQEWREAYREFLNPKKETEWIPAPEETNGTRPPENMIREEISEDAAMQMLKESVNNKTIAMFNQIPLQIMDKKDPRDKQVGGNHYKDNAIQPIDYIHSNNLSFFEGSAIKYITRHRKKKGKEDILKAIHYLEMILHYDYPEKVSKGDFSTTDHLGVKEVPVETKGNGLLDGVKKPSKAITKLEDLNRIINNPDNNDGAEIHIFHLWKNRDFASIFKITGIPFTAMLDRLDEEDKRNKVERSLAGKISSGQIRVNDINFNGTLV